MRADILPVSGNFLLRFLTQPSDLPLLQDNLAERNNGEKQGGPGFAGNPWINMAWQLGKPILYRWMGEVGWQVFKSMFCRRRAE